LIVLGKKAKRRKIMKNTIISVMAIVALGFFLPNVQAELIIINITATVDIVNDFGNYLEGKIHVGDTITGWYTYESTTVDSDLSDPTQGNYWHYASPAGISLTVGGFNFRTNPDNVNFLVSIGNNASEQDNYLVRSYNNLSLSNGTLVEGIDWQLDDHTQTAFSSDALPVTAPIPLSQWQYNDLILDGEHSGYGIDATVISAEVIPEPATLLLLGAGIMLLRKHS
jgi:hypothetical protein